MLFDSSDELTREALDWQLIPPVEELYVEQSWAPVDVDDNTRKRVPNLMLIGYLLRVLEDRLLPDTEHFDA